MKSVILVLVLVLASLQTIRASPVTAQEYLQQESQSNAQSGLIVFTTCGCEERKFPLWPLLFIGLVPLAFIGHDHHEQSQFTPPAITPIVTPTPIVTTPTSTVPEPSTWILGITGLMGLILFKLRSSKAMLIIAFMILGGYTVEAKSKSTLTITSSPTGMSVMIDGKSAPSTPTEVKLDRKTIHRVEITLPDGKIWRQQIDITKVCNINLDFTPPGERIIDNTKVEIPKIPIPCPTPEVLIPIPPKQKPYKFDECCDCRSNDLKARLDSLAIELNRDPSLSGLIIGSKLARDYLIYTRHIDTEKINFKPSSTKCVELWIIPRE